MSRKKSVQAKVYITLKPGILDAQGKTIKSALDTLGFGEIDDVRIGKYIEIEFSNARTKNDITSEVSRMCQKLLSNPVIETYRIEIPGVLPLSSAVSKV